MSNIAKAFAHGKAFIPFITCGDPDLETTAEIVHILRHTSYLFGYGSVCKQHILLYQLIVVL